MNPLSATFASRRRIWLWATLLVTLTVFAYQPAWHAGFIWDDDDYVTHNPLLTAPDGLQRIWFSTDSPSQYFPLVYTTFRLEHALWGLNPVGYHWVNLLLHAANALLVWRLLARLAIPGAWFAAAVFALHPVQVESVAWVTELKNIESLFFCLLALLAWIEFVGQRASALTYDGKWKPWGIYAFALAAYALALFAKTTACTLPAALLLILWLKEKRLALGRLVQIAPFVALGVAMGLLTVWWEHHRQGTDATVFGLGPLERLLIASRALWFYLGKLLWPADLMFSYPHWTIDRTNPLAYAWLTALVGVVAAIFAGRRFIGRSVGVAALFFVATLSPLLGFIMLYTFRYAFVADHYQYFALLGPVAVAAALLHTRLKNARLRSVLCGALLATLGVASWRQCRIYRNRETLWRATLAKNPDSYLAHNNLSAVLVEQGASDEAIAHAQKALELQPAGPDLALAHINLGNAQLQKGNVDEAIRRFRLAIEAQPDFADAHNNLGGALLDKGQDEEAIVHLQQSLSLQPHHANAHYNLGNAYLRQGRNDAAIAEYQAALALRPDDADGHNNLATVLIGAGRLEEAAKLLRRTLELRPDFAAAHSNLGFVLLRQGRAREAAAQYELALKLQPDNAATLFSFAWLLATCPENSVRNGARAIELAQRANQISDGANPVVLHALAAAYAEGGRFPEAVRAAERALELASAQPGDGLADTLKSQLQLYQAGAPFRDGGP